MAELLNLNALEVGKLTAEYRWLIYRDGKGEIEISTPNIEPTVLEVGDVFDLGDTSQGAHSVRVRNMLGEQNDIKLQVSKQQIVTNNTKQVKIVGGNLDSILEPFEVTATATVENGTVTNLSHDTLEDKADMPIAAGATVVVLAANNAALRRVVSVQNISATETLLRVGSANVAAGRGSIIKGSIDAIASWDLDCVGDVRIHNESAQAALVTVSWGVK
jgi:hypothetical protein